MNHPMGPLQLGSYFPSACFYHLIYAQQPICACVSPFASSVPNNPPSPRLNETPACSIGLDTCLAIQQTLYEGTRDSKYRPSVLLERMVDAQWYGRKNGKGFYEYDE
jgi:hypothetical protein